MPDASLLTPDDNRFVGLFIGKSGAGKKAAGCSFPKPIKYFDFDGRIRGLLGVTWYDRKGIDYTYYPPIRAGAQDDNVFTKLNKDLAAMLIQSQVGQLPYKTIYIGSLTGEAFTFLQDAIPLTHKSGKGKSIGTLEMPDPGDYGYQSQAMQQVMAFFRSIPGVNVIFAAHTVDRYGKVPGDDGKINPYGESVRVGEKLNLTDKLSEILPSGFDNIFKFSKIENGNREQYFVKFRGDMPRTVYPQLETGEVDITGKNFYEYLMSKIGTKSVQTDTK